MCPCVNTSAHLCRQLSTAPGLTFQVIKYLPNYPIDREYGFLIQYDEAMSVVSSYSNLRGFKLSTVSSACDLWSLSDNLSRTYLSEIDKLLYSNYLQGLMRDSITSYLNRGSVEGCGHPEIEI
jgi:hypothetical protein